MKSLKNLFAFFFILFLFSACSLQKKPKIIYPEIRNHKVSVVQDGKEIAAGQNKHIHNIKLLKRRLPNSPSELPFEFLPIQDSQERIRGLMVRERVPVYSKFIMGLTKGDIITNIEQVVASSDSEIRLLLDTLRYKGKATVSIERDGKPHKLFFSTL